MKAALGWLLLLLLLSGLLLFAHWGLQVTAFPYYLAITAATALATLLAMRWLAPAPPSDQSQSNSEQDHQ